MFLYTLGSAMCSFIEFLSLTECHASRNSLFIAKLVTCRQFPHSPNLCHGCGAHGVWPTKNFHTMLLWPLRVLSRVFLVRVMFDQHKQYHNFYI